MKVPLSHTYDKFPASIEILLMISEKLVLLKYCNLNLKRCLKAELSKEY